MKITAYQAYNPRQAMLAEGFLSLKMDIQRLLSASPAGADFQPVWGMVTEREHCNNRSGKTIRHFLLLRRLSGPLAGNLKKFFA